MSISCFAYPLIINSHLGCFYLWLSQIMLQCLLVCKFLFEHLFSVLVGTYLGIELLSHRLIPCLPLWGIAEMWYVAIGGILFFSVLRLRDDPQMLMDSPQWVRSLKRQSVAVGKHLWTAFKWKKLKWKTCKHLKYLGNVFNHVNDFVTFTSRLADVGQWWLWVLRSQMSSLFGPQSLSAVFWWPGLQSCCHGSRKRSERVRRQNVESVIVHSNLQLMFYHLKTNRTFQSYFQWDKAFFDQT